MVKIDSFSIGRIKIHAIDAGRQWLDGGAMFGVVPKPLWEKRIPADERNRIPLALRVLLVETPDARVLVDSGIGNKEDERFRKIYGVENDAPGFPTLLEAGLAQLGVKPDDIDIMLNTHLHFDHAGGDTRRNEEGQVVLSFPRARHLVQKGEFEWAHLDNERIRASYLSHNFDSVPFEFQQGDVNVIPGIDVRVTPGHTPWHQSVLISDGGETACFLADLIPTSAHLGLPWIMGYDVEPLRTMESKRQLLAQAQKEGWQLIFEHDPVVSRGQFEGQTFIPHVTSTTP